MTDKKREDDKTGWVSVPKALLLDVLEGAYQNSLAVENEWNEDLKQEREIICELQRLAAAPQPMGCGLPCGYDCNGACFDAAAPQPAPMDRKALVEVIREARHKWICDDADGVGDDQDLTIANALLARGLRLPGDETMAWAVVGEDGSLVGINYDRGTAQHLCNPGERIERVAIRVVEGGDDAA